MASCTFPITEVTTATWVLELNQSGAGEGNAVFCSKDITESQTGLEP